MRKLSRVGPPDARKRACPVRAGAGRKPTAERQKWAPSFDQHYRQVGVLKVAVYRKLALPYGLRTMHPLLQEVRKRLFINRVKGSVSENIDLPRLPMFS